MLPTHAVPAQSASAHVSEPRRVWVTSKRKVICNKRTTMISGSYATSSRWVSGTWPPMRASQPHPGQGSSTTRVVSRVAFIQRSNVDRRRAMSFSSDQELQARTCHVAGIIEAKNLAFVIPQ